LRKVLVYIPSPLDFSKFSLHFCEPEADLNQVPSVKNLK
jgi:hypothetical protein